MDNLRNGIKKKYSLFHHMVIDSTSNVHCNVSAIPRSHLNYTCLDVMLVDKLAGIYFHK